MNPIISKSAFSALLLSFVFTGCQTTQEPVMTPLEIQSMQTRSYTGTQNLVFRSVVSVFQDLGYTIKSADISTGFIQADGTAKSNESLKFWTGYTQTTQTKATAFVEQLGAKTQVRLNFVTTKESSTMYGADDRKETPILNAQIYQNAFERIENAIFIRQSSN